jgi:mono/diheme cytochrome c family protein
MRILLGLALVAALAGCGSSGTPATTSTAAPTTSPAASTTTAATGTTAPTPTASIAASIPAKPAALAAGRRLFQAPAHPAGCGFCHSFRAAKTVSPLGPSLDAEVTEADLRRLTDAQLAQRVRNWMHQPQCFGPTDATRCMPADLYTGAEANAIAVFVATCGRHPHTAGCAPVAGGLTGEALAGERLFQTRGCVGCHFTIGPASTGPVLNGLAGSKVKLADGTTVTADRAYLIRSIAAPDSQIVAGYQPGLMSARVLPQRLTRAQVAALATYLETLR